MLEATLYQQSLPTGTPITNTTCGQFWLAAKLSPILETTLGLFPQGKSTNKATPEQTPERSISLAHSKRSTDPRR